ncbi:MAG: FAD-dependent oxidoreductase [Desulfurococcales archaeon]|nr:FAD-dependent oxidoreductase [Desulfurococcales archaeon]
MSRKVVVLGGGQAGLQTALLLKKLSSSLEVALVERNVRVVYKPLLTWVAVGKTDPENITIDISDVKKAGVKLYPQAVESIDLNNRVVRLSKSELQYDYLVIALGAEPNEEAVKGLKKDNLLAWTLNGALGLREALASGRSRRVVVGAASPPFPCPPAPFELAGLVRKFLGKSLGEKASVKAVTFEEKPLMGLGPEVSSSLVDLLERSGIELLSGFKVVEVDTNAKRVISESGDAIPYDLLSLVPPFKPPKPVTDLEIAGPGGWLVTDPYKGFRTRLGEVFAVGDIALPPFGAPMSGFLGSYMARSAAREILAEAAGVSVDHKERAYAECFVDHEDDGIGIYCDFTDVIYGGGKPHCHIMAHGTLVGEYKAALERSWRKTLRNFIEGA